MKSKILSAIGIDPGIILILLIILCVGCIAMLVNLHMKYDRLKSSYNTFMKGKDAKTLEEGFAEHFKMLEGTADAIKQNRQAIKGLYRKMDGNYQKLGIVKYDAFNEMGGKLSFALAVLDGNNNGFIMNAMHSREGCYNYIKEVVKGQSYIELSEEEAESLERAIYQEAYGLDIKDINK